MSSPSKESSWSSPSTERTHSSRAAPSSVPDPGPERRGACTRPVAPFTVTVEPVGVALALGAGGWSSEARPLAELGPLPPLPPRVARNLALPTWQSGGAAVQAALISVQDTELIRIGATDLAAALGSPGAEVQTAINAGQLRLSAAGRIRDQV